MFSILWDHADVIGWGGTLIQFYHRNSRKLYFLTWALICISWTFQCPSKFSSSFGNSSEYFSTWTSVQLPPTSGWFFPSGPNSAHQHPPAMKLLEVLIIDLTAGQWVSIRTGMWFVPSTPSLSVSEMHSYFPHFVSPQELWSDAAHALCLWTLFWEQHCKQCSLFRALT